MRKIISLCATLLCAMTMSAELIKDGFVEYVPNFVQHTATITFMDFSKVNQEVYTIPSSVMYEGEEYIVTSISESALKNGRRNTVCKKIIVPSSITSLEKAVFREFMNIQEIELQSQLKEIPSSTFSLCSSLETITLPEGLTRIGSKAFSGCKALKSINIPSTVTNIYDQAFSQTQIQELVLPEGMTVINDGAFENMRRLQKITIPSSVTQIENNAFAYDERLADIVLPPQLSSIGDKAFFGCISLVQINIPANVRKIGVKAFESCSELKQISFPAGIEYIGRESFINCSNLESVAFIDALPPTIGFSAFDNTKLSTVYVPRGCVESYKKNAGDGAYRPFLENMNVIATDNEPDITLMLAFVEEKHKQLSRPFEGTREETFVIQKYIELYDALSPIANSVDNVMNLYRIQKLFNQNPFEYIKKPLAKELKSAKNPDAIYEIFKKYLQ